MKSYINILFVCSILALLLSSCSDSSNISSSKAMALVADYVEDNPIFETGKFSIQKVRLDSKNNPSEINNLQTLETEGYIEIVDEKKRKKWFSKDSVFIVTPTLTEKSYPYIVKQNKNNIEVKTLMYDVDLTQEVTFEKKTNKQAIFNVLLLKKKTPFYAYGKDSNPHGDFITRKFKAKYNPETGWELVR